MTEDTESFAGFKDRKEAGRQLGAALKKFPRPDIVLALPRGGVPVAQPVAEALGAPLDVLVVRKLGLPGQEELAMGAIAPGGITILDDDILQLTATTADALERVREDEQRELERREARYRAGRPPLELNDKAVVLVDDGLATGSTMRAALAAVRRMGAASVMVAVPISSAEACASLRPDADEVFCLHTPAAFRAVGQWYLQFEQTSDEEVQAILDGPAA